MKALVSERPGPSETLVLRPVDIPEPGKGELRIKVEACGINYPDVLMIEDKYQFTFPRPFTPGIEVCGVIEALGEGVTGVEPGARVLAQISHGGLAEKAIASVETAFPVPDGVKPELAASMLLTYATAYHALRDRAALKAGETLLVMGGAGGVGLAAIDLGRAMGARVVAGVSSAAKAEAARAMGASDVLIYPASPADPRALGEQFKSACPHGFDAVFDPVGGAYAEPAIRRMAWNGRYLVVGFAAGIPAPPLNLVLLKGCQLIGVFWGAFASRYPVEARAIVLELLDMLRSRVIRPQPPHLYPLSDGAAAIAALRDRTAIGKLVVTP